MQTPQTMSAKLQEVLDRGVLVRLPLTFLPFVNQQLKQWDYLFPNERQSVERLLVFVASLSPDQSERLFREVVQLEAKMGVQGWQFSTSEQTILNSSQLARSPYFQEWRKAVQSVFDAADRKAANEEKLRPVNRLILIDLPAVLPVHAERIWRPWQGAGHAVHLDLSSAGSPSLLEYLLTRTRARDGSSAPGLLDLASNRSGSLLTDNWTIDAGGDLADSVLDATGTASRPARTILLSYARLETYRQRFCSEMNTMRKDLADADAVYDRLRAVDVSPWCPPEVAADPLIREFLRSLFLSGNGAVIFGNSFVEWAAAEAFRRARPAFLATRFGVRSKPKPFTGVAVFENPDQINPLPPVDDYEGSAEDAQRLALYIWLAATRFDEYRASTVCVTVAENIAQAYLVAPPEFSLSGQPGPITLERLRQALCSWIV